MALIEIHRTHSLGRERARSAAEKMASHLDERFHLNYRWEGDSLHFKRAGIDGHLNVNDAEISIKVRLGLLMLPIKHRLEEEIDRYLARALEQA